MPESTVLDGSLTELRPPARNRYFFGKLLDVRHLVMEQDYLNRKRWLLNRLGLGAGVLCGLEVSVSGDGQKLWVEPGVAIDVLGREIIVPSRVCIDDPRQPTDEAGRPSGPRVEEGMLTLCVSYHECDTEPVPVLVRDCDTREDCASSTVLERFRFQIREGIPDERPGTLEDEACAAVFPQPAPQGFNHREAACNTIMTPCDPIGDDCVTLATIVSKGGELFVDDCAFRTVVYSNSMLLDLIFCLADRVQACCDTRVLRYVSGDAQQGAPGAVLDKPIVVEVADGDGNVVDGETVTFRVTGGGGEVGDGAAFAAQRDVVTGPDGRAQSTWKLGPAAGLDTVEATIASGSRVGFTALAIQREPEPEPEPTGEPPVVTGLWPPNDADWTRDTNDDEIRESWDEWKKQPRLEVTFSHEMAEASLQDPREWLRMWILRAREEEGFLVERLPLEFAGEVAVPMSGAQKFTVAYVIPMDFQMLVPGTFIVQMRSRNNLIVDTNAPPLELGALFNGTNLKVPLLERIWKVEDTEGFPFEPLASLAGTGDVLPSRAGVRFHAWFRIRH